MDLEAPKPLSEATSIEEFKKLRYAEPKTDEPAEPAAKTTQSEEDTPIDTAAEGTASTQESEPVAKSVEQQIKDLRAKSQHAAANKLMAEEAARPHREETERLRKELEGLRAKPAEAKPEAKEPAKAEDPEPQPTDEKYAGDDGFTKFQRDISRWDARQEVRAEMRAAESKRGESVIEQKVKTLMAEARKAKPDFDDVTSRVVISIPVLREAVEKIDNIADVLYAFGSDPAQLAWIKALPPTDQYAELRIKSRDLKTPPAAPAAPPVPLKPAVSRIAAAPRVLSGTDEPEPKSTAEARTFEEYKRLRHRAS